MAIDMKENSKMVNSMVKVHLGTKGFPLCVINLFAFKIGKYFSRNGEKYEGEFKDDKLNG